MIRRLYIHNFRCLENFELPIAGNQSTLLIGKNGSGKSSISLALEVLQSIARGTNKVDQIISSLDFAQRRWDTPMRFEVEVLLKDIIYEYAFAVEYALDNNFRELRISQEYLSAAGRPVYSRDHSHISLAKTDIVAEARFLIDWHLFALPVIQAQSESDPIHIFKTWLARMLLLAPVPSLITGDAEGETLTPDRQATNLGAWFTGLLAYSPASYALIDRYLREIMPDFKDIKNPVHGTNFRRLMVQFQQDKTSLSLWFRDLSDGEKCFFLCALVLAANESYGPLFCFWDEPDNYLAPAEVGHFVMALRRSFQNGGQLLVTSHNVEAVRQFSSENTLVLSRRSHLEPTVVRPLSELSVEGDLGDALVRGDIDL